MLGYVGESWNIVEYDFAGYLILGFRWLYAVGARIYWCTSFLIIFDGLFGRDFAIGRSVLLSGVCFIFGRFHFKRYKRKVI